MIEIDLTALPAERPSAPENTMPTGIPSGTWKRLWQLAYDHAPEGLKERELLELANEIDPDAWRFPIRRLQRFLSLQAAERVMKHLRLDDPVPPFVLHVTRTAALDATPKRKFSLRNLWKKGLRNGL